MKNPLWLDNIIGKLNAEEARDLSDETLKNVLGPCVAGNKLVELAMKYRDEGILKLSDLRLARKKKILKKILPPGNYPAKILNVKINKKGGLSMDLMVYSKYGEGGRIVKSRI